MIQRTANRLRPPIVVMTILHAILLAGCDEEDRRLAELAKESAERQAKQNEIIARQSQEVAGAAKALVEADSEARKELVVMQKSLQAESAEVGRQRDQLEVERKEIAEERRWDSTLSSAVSTTGIVLACLLPLVVCIYLLHASRNQPESGAELAELLTYELVAERPVLLSPPQAAVSPAIGCDGPAGPALAAPADPEAGDAEQNRA